MIRKFLNLFKSEPPPEKEKLAFKSVERWLNKRRADIEAREESLQASLRNRVETMLSEFNKKLEVLKSTDFESKKVEPRIKAIVRGNLKKYLTQVGFLEQNIRSLDETSLHTYVAEIRSILDDFFKKTHINHQKASILVGNEIADAHKCVTEFAQFLKSTVESNKEEMDTSHMISSIQGSLSEIKEIERSIKEIEKSRASLNGKIKSRNEKISALSAEIERVKRSKSYADTLRRAEEAQKRGRNLKRAMNDLRASIDFKALGNEFHGDAKRMGIVRAHKENFEEALGDGTALLGLLSEAGIDEGAAKKIERINQLKESIGSANFTDDTERLRSQQELLKSDIQELREEIKTQKKREAKLVPQREAIIDSIVEEFSKIGVVVRR